MLAASALGAGFPTASPADGERDRFAEMASFARTLIPEEASRGVGFCYTPGFSAYRDVRMAVYLEDERAHLSIDVSFSAGGGVTRDEPMATYDFDALWAELLASDAGDLGDAIPLYDGPPPTDTVTFAVAYRDGAAVNSFVVRDPGSLADGRYDRIVRILDAVMLSSLNGERSPKD